MERCANCQLSVVVQQRGCLLDVVIVRQCTATDGVDEEDFTTCSLTTCSLLTLLLLGLHQLRCAIFNL